MEGRQGGKKSRQRECGMEGRYTRQKRERKTGRKSGGQTLEKGQIQKEKEGTERTGRITGRKEWEENTIKRNTGKDG